MKIKNKVNKHLKFDDPITVTKPSLPDLKDFVPYLEKIWANKWLTNNGVFHQSLEKELNEFLGVDNIALCSNGTLALILALKALDIEGEVITTPFSFVATSHAISWCSCTPVFADICPDTMNIDPKKIEELITDKTTAIMPVHVYGNPCDHDKIMEIAEKHDLKVIYDAAHAFKVSSKGQSILNWGDLSVLSFHATKVFNTFEGGAIVCHTQEMKQKIDDLKNFGFHGETSVVDIGINAKMNEVQAAMGLEQLKLVESNIDKRKELALCYENALKDIAGIECIVREPEIQHNYSYFPVLVNEEDFGISRDELYEELKKYNVRSRRYFYPLISSFPMYNCLESASNNNLPVANRMAEEILCLPIYPDLRKNDVIKIVELIKICNKEC